MGKFRYPERSPVMTPDFSWFLGFLVPGEGVHYFINSHGRAVYEKLPCSSSQSPESRVRTTRLIKENQIANMDVCRAAASVRVYKFVSCFIFRAV